MEYGDRIYLILFVPAIALLYPFYEFYMYLLEDCLELPEWVEGFFSILLCVIGIIFLIKVNKFTIE